MFTSQRLENRIGRALAFLVAITFPLSGVTAPGEFELLVGTSSQSIELRGKVTVR